MTTIFSASGGRMRTRSQAQVSDKRSADELEGAPFNTAKRSKTCGGRRQVLQPISIKEELKEDASIKSESASPVRLTLRNTQAMSRRRDPQAWDDGMHLPPSPPYPSTTNQSSSPAGRLASRLTAKLRSRKARTEIGIAPKIENSSRTRQEDEVTARGVSGRQGSTAAPSITVLRQEEQRREEDLKILREQIASHYPSSGSWSDGYVANSELESEDGSSSGEDDTGSRSNDTKSIQERSSDINDSEDSEHVDNDSKDSSSDSDDTESDEDENEALVRVRSRLRLAMCRVASPVPKEEDGDTTDSKDEDEHDAAPSPAKIETDDHVIKSSFSVASSSAVCSTCGDSEASEDDDSESHADNVPIDIESNIPIYNDEEDAHTRLNEALRRAPAPSPLSEHHTAVNQSIHNEVQLQSPAHIIQRRQQQDGVINQDEDLNAARFQSSSPPRAYDYDEYRLRARYLEQFKGMTAAQLDEAGRDLDYVARKLNSKRSAYEMALHERAFPRY
ncbi:hypothetical protein MCOR25_005947 [Pyricularia grisea]|nr:hypothetical protein MCOR25_005947 [Pyricularia grisea]